MGAQRLSDIRVLGQSQSHGEGFLDVFMGDIAHCERGWGRKEVRGKYTKILSYVSFALWVVQITRTKSMMRIICDPVGQPD